MKKNKIEVGQCFYNPEWKEIFEIIEIISDYKKQKRHGPYRIQLRWSPTVLKFIGQSAGIWGSWDLVRVAPNVTLTKEEVLKCTRPFPREG